MVRRERGTRGREGDNERLTRPGSHLVHVGSWESYAEWLHFNRLEGLSAWGPSLGERKRENLFCTPNPPVVPMTWTQSWEPEASHGTCCGNGINDPTVLSGWRAWPGAGWGNTQKVCSQRESKEGQANKEGWPSPDRKNQGKIDHFRSHWSL